MIHAASPGGALCRVRQGEAGMIDDRRKSETGRSTGVVATEEQYIEHLLLPEHHSPTPCDLSAPEQIKASHRTHVTRVPLQFDGRKCHER